MKSLPSRLVEAQGQHKRQQGQNAHIQQSTQIIIAMTTVIVVINGHQHYTLFCEGERDVTECVMSITITNVTSMVKRAPSLFVQSKYSNCVAVRSQVLTQIGLEYTLCSKCPCINLPRCTRWTNQAYPQSRFRARLYFTYYISRHSLDSSH